MVALIVNIYQSDYLLSSRVGVMSQVPDEVSVRQDVKVPLYAHPHRILFSKVWLYLLAGRSGS